MGMTGFWQAAFLLHLSASAVLGVVLLLEKAWTPRRDPFRPVRWYAFLLFVFFPYFGAVGAALFYAAVRLGGERFRAGVREEYESYISEKREETLRTTVFADFVRKIRAEVNFEPFTDILRGGEIRLKVRAIEKLAKHPSPESVRLLKEGLKDRSPEVRLHAASSMLSIEAALQEKIDRAIEAARRQGTAKAHAHLGNLYRMYVDAGVMEPTLARYYLTLARDAYRNSLDVDTSQSEVVLAYGRCLVELQEYEQAKKLMDPAMKIWPDEKAMVFLRNEIYFALGIFDGIAESFRRIAPQAAANPREKEVLAFWTQET